MPLHLCSSEKLSDSDSLKILPPGKNRLCLKCYLFFCFPLFPLVFKFVIKLAYKKLSWKKQATAVQLEKQ